MEIKGVGGCVIGFRRDKLPWLLIDTAEVGV